MIYLYHLVLFIVFGIAVSIAGIIGCLFCPRNPTNVKRYARLYSIFLNPILGIKVHNRPHEKVKEIKNCIMIANHQDNFDIIIASEILVPRTVAVGKKSLVWVPFFGPLFYLSGNIVIDRNNLKKARDTIEQVIREIKTRNISVWMFPEGTRSKGRGLLPFKSGAFKAAVAAGVPIVPICISDTSKIDTHRWNNGNIIVEMQEPIETKDLGKQDVRELMNRCHELMSARIKELNVEAQALNNQQ